MKSESATPSLGRESQSVTGASGQSDVSMPRQAVEQLQRMALLGELTSTATHEFNNLLMTVINYAKLGIRNQDAASRDKYFDKILMASQKAATITGTILAQVRNRGDALVPTDLNNLISDTLVLLGKEMQKHRIAVETQLDADVPMAMANGNQIQSVLINLMINARQAMQEGGTLLISLTHEREQSAVAISVRDSGCGIPEEKLPHIFDSFYSTKSGPDAGGTGGTGLGLSAARQAIAAHGGKIRVESSVGVGTQFTLLIPVADAERSAA